MSVGTQDSQIASTGEQLARARELAERAIERYSNDGDLDRTDDEWRANIFLGARAEVAAEQFFRDLGLDAHIVDDGDEQAHDIVVEGLTVEVKLRRLWTYYNPDLLLRFDEELSADLYLMVEADKTPNGHSLEVTKWATRQTVEENVTEFRENRPKVDREYLDDIDTLSEELESHLSDDSSPCPFESGGWTHEEAERILRINRIEYEMQFESDSNE